MALIERSTVGRSGNDHGPGPLLLYRKGAARPAVERTEVPSLVGAGDVGWNPRDEATSAAAFTLLIVEFDGGARWNVGVVVFVIIATAVHPGGLGGPRAAAAADEPARAPRR